MNSKLAAKVTPLNALPTEAGPPTLFSCRFLSINHLWA
jgi:hypothetical protein